MFRLLPHALTFAVISAAVGCGDDAGVTGSHDPESPYVHTVDGGVQTDAKVRTDAKTGTGTGTHTGTGGSSDDDGGTYTNTCDSLTIMAAPNPPDVLIVLDRSGSMNGNNATGTNRWTPSSKVIKSITSQLDSVMNFGMMLFPDPMGDTGAFSLWCGVGKLSVPIAAGSSAAIAQAIDASPPKTLSATPTAATLHAALSAIDSDPACADSCAARHKYVLLVTDGAPNCGDGHSASTLQSDIDSCNTGIDALKTDGVTTYVIGYDTTDTKTAAIMDGFAMHGGTGKQLPVEDEKSLLATMTSIAGQLVSCDYKLSMEVENPKFVRVTVDGTQYDLGDGWTLDADMKTVHLGSACNVLRDAKVHNLHITLECSEVIAI